MKMGDVFPVELPQEHRIEWAPFCLFLKGLCCAFPSFEILARLINIALLLHAFHSPTLLSSDPSLLARGRGLPRPR